MSSWNSNKISLNLRNIKKTIVLNILRIWWRVTIKKTRNIFIDFFCIAIESPISINLTDNWSAFNACKTFPSNSVCICQCELRIINIQNITTLFMLIPLFFSFFLSSISWMSNYSERKKTHSSTKHLYEGVENCETTKNISFRTKSSIFSLSLHTFTRIHIHV